MQVCASLFPGSFEDGCEAIRRSGKGFFQRVALFSRYTLRRRVKQGVSGSGWLLASEEEKCGR